MIDYSVLDALVADVAKRGALFAARQVRRVRSAAGRGDGRARGESATQGAAHAAPHGALADTHGT